MNTNVYKRQWDVQSFTSDRMYKVSERHDGDWECSCPHWINRHPEGGCKHIKKLQQAIRYLPASPVFAEVVVAPRVSPDPTTGDVVAFEGYAITRRRLDDTAVSASVPERRSRNLNDKQS